ncbi:PREDICTED: uncharacterized protein LOC103582933 [Galeopterus variegatus]|uniref:Uncharacterized protein LOC103582933 n=1 Tax=Galeopterus variegatus TaxID=482537 RepID=A0ABM0Q2M2_GALVR|nr:PREDICTED: uncharacterized protein LOC103582933 [Galeopterus variegatus]
MLSVTCSVLVILIFSRSNGDSVTQTGPVTVSEGAPVILNCTYQTTYSISVLLWYVQYLNKAPQLLLKSSTENQRTEGQGFQANHVKSDSFFYLKKPSAQMSDSAVYYCALIDTMRGAAGGAEHKPRGAQAALAPVVAVAVALAGYPHGSGGSREMACSYDDGGCLVARVVAATAAVTVAVAVATCLAVVSVVAVHIATVSQQQWVYLMEVSAALITATASLASAVSLVATGIPWGGSSGTSGCSHLSCICTVCG